MSIVKLACLFTSTFSNLLKQSAHQTIVPSIITRGLKHKGTLELRCRDCYFEKIDSVWWVLCKTHGRHKQRQLIDDVKKKWIVTHRTYGHRPFQKKPEAYICNLAPPGPYDYKRNYMIVDHEIDNKYARYIRKTRLGLNRKLMVNLDGVKDPVSLY